MFLKNSLTKEQALEKIKHYCNYQERCHKEVRERLYSYGLRKNEVDKIISQLIENNYLNEERFAVQFAGGKFRMKLWGRKKIQYELQQKGINSFIINIALSEIDQDKYLDRLHKLAKKKWEVLNKENNLTRQSKTTSYLLQKGYEQRLISEVIRGMK